MNTQEKVIIFIDICNYTFWCNHNSNQCIYRKTLQYYEYLTRYLPQDMYKLETVGDCYVAYSKNVNSVIDYAICIMNKVDKLQILFNTFHIDIKIGIHVGEVIIDINDNLVKFFGKHMNFTSRLQTLADIHQIQISQNVFDKLKRKYQQFFNQRRILDIKGFQNKIVTYVYTPIIENPKVNITQEEKSRNILLIDDMQITLRLITKILNQTGYNVITCSNSHDALQKLKSKVFQFVICDIYMPLYNGCDLVRDFRRWEHSENIFTKQYIYAFSFDDEFSEYRKYGFDNFLSKNDIVHFINNLKSVK